MDIASMYNEAVADVSDAIEKIVEATEKPAKKPRRKKTAKVKAVVEAQAPRRVGRPRKAAVPASSPRKMPKTKLVSVSFRGDCAELTFRDFRKLKTPLKYMDKRLSRLSPKELRSGEVSKNGQRIAWADRGILVDVATVLHFEA